MAVRPKRTYNQETGQWEVEKLWDTRDSDGLYWKDGVQVDSSGVPIYDAQGNEQGAEDPMSAEATSTEATGVGGGDLPVVGDETIEQDDPRNLVTVGSQIMSYSDNLNRQSALTRGAGKTAQMNTASKQGNTRRQIRAKKTLISGAR